MALRLHEAAHDAKWAHGRAVLGQEARDDGVVGPFARRQAVRVGRIEREIVAAVLQRNAGAGHHQARTKAHVIALDKGHHVAIAVGRAQVNRAAARRLTRRRQSRLRTDQGPALVGVGI